MKNLIYCFGLLLLAISPKILIAQDAEQPLQVQSTLDQQLAQVPQELQTDDDKPGLSRFLLRGYAHSGLEVTKEDFSFVGGSFNPILVFRQSDRLLFESELEFEIEDGQLAIGLEYADMSYIISKGLTLRVGKFLTPFGKFIPDLHPAWINKFPTKPLGAGHHGGILPTDDIGVELRGGAYLGNMKTNYSFYAVNGPRLNDGSVEPEEGGMLHFGMVPDNNKQKSFGTRISIFPFSNSSLELGFSAQTGKVGAKESKYEDVGATLFGLDLSYVKNITGMSSVIDIKGQYTMAKVDDADYPEPEDPTVTHTFDNKSTAWFAQVSIRPAFVSSKLFQNLELASRYSALKTPDGAPWGVDQTQFEIGLNYWIDWRTVFKFSYRSISGGAEAEHGGEESEEGMTNAFFIHWAIGF